mmetsp:Transcript_5006/g.14713  ORF Transcript_5006/g.14713 Transcript_5006/m.14713 type:complete len:252 (+) Transcript_5006:126-881(+)
MAPVASEALRVVALAIYPGHDPVQCQFACLAELFARELAGLPPALGAMGTGVLALDASPASSATRPFMVRACEVLAATRASKARQVVVAVVQWAQVLFSAADELLARPTSHGGRVPKAAAGEQVPRRDHSRPGAADRRVAEVAQGACLVERVTVRCHDLWLIRPDALRALLTHLHRRTPLLACLASAAVEFRVERAHDVLSAQSASKTLLMEDVAVRIEHEAIAFRDLVLAPPAVLRRCRPVVARPAYWTV